MVKIISELEKIGFGITDEQKESIKKSIGEELYSKQELDKKISKVETERDNYKKRADTAEDTLKGFEGKDFDEITKDRDEWKRKAEQAEKDFNAKNCLANPAPSNLPAAIDSAAVFGFILPAHTTGIRTNCLICSTSSRLQFSGI